jgi:hypothetical protein
MPLRTRIFVIVSLILLFAIGVTLLLINKYRKKTPPITNTPTSTINDTSAYKVIDASNFDINKINSTGNTSTIPPKKYTETEATQHSVIQLAKIFTERYGSYSTDNNSQNVIEVKELVTKDLWEKIKPVSGIKSANGFKGVSTEVFSTEVNKWSDTEAAIKLRTIRTQEVNKVVTTIQQVADVSLVKQGNNWLINNFLWEK